MADTLPYIEYEVSKTSLCGDLIETKKLIIQGRTLKECKKVFEKEWNHV